MYKLYVLVLLNTSKGIFANPTEPINHDNDHEIYHNSHPILPFVMVKWLPQGKYIEPWKVYQREADNRIVFSTLLVSNEKYLCPANNGHHVNENNHSNEITTRDSRQPHISRIPDHCLFPKKFSQQQIPQCADEATPVIEKITHGVEMQDVNCGHEKNGKLYSFQYKLCFEPTWEQSIAGFFSSAFKDIIRPPMNVMHFGLYTFCYDHRKKETIYTEHVILSPSLINASSLKQEREKKFHMKADGYGMFENDFEAIKNIYIEKRDSTSEPLIGSHESHYSKPLASSESTYLAHQLVPPDDMVFALWRKATFHFVNVKPMHEKLVPLWDHVCELVRLHAKADSKNHYKITTGAFVLHSEEHNEHHNNFNTERIVPKLWVKVVRNVNSREGVAFVMSNHFDGIPERYCETDLCTFSDHQDHHKSADTTRYLRCCPITEKIEDLFGIEMRADRFLRIEGIHGPQTQIIHHHQGIYYVLRKEMPTYQELNNPPSVPLNSPPETPKIQGGKINVKLVTNGSNTSDTKGEGKNQLSIPFHIPPETILSLLSGKPLNLTSESASHVNTPPMLQSASQGNVHEPQPNSHINTPNSQAAPPANTLQQLEPNVSPDKNAFPTENFSDTKPHTLQGNTPSTNHLAHQGIIQHPPQQHYSDQLILPLVFLKFLDEYVAPRTVKRHPHYNRLEFSTTMSGSEIYFCPADRREEKIVKAEEMIRKRNSDPNTSEKKKISENIFDHCLVVKHFEENQVPICNREAIPVIDTFKQPEAPSIATKCGHEGILYSFHYDLCRFNSWWQKMTKPIKQGFTGLKPSPFRDVIAYDIYKFCYDHNKKETIYTQHLISSSRLLDQYEMKPEQVKQFDMRTDGYKHFGDNFVIYKEALLRENMLGQQNRVEFQSHESLYVAHPLVPPDDMAFALWRKPTFHVVNMKPMHRELVPLWNAICQHIRLHAKKNPRNSYKIYTGAFEVPTMRSSDRIRIPELWVKVVIDVELLQATVIIMSNHFENVLGNYCDTNRCKLKIPEELAVLAARYVHCCPISDQMRQLFNIKWYRAYILNIDGITM